MLEDLLKNGFVIYKDILIFVTNCINNDNLEEVSGVVKINPIALIEILENYFPNEKTIEIFKFLEDKNIFPFKFIFKKDLNNFGLKLEMNDFKLKNDDIERLGINRNTYAKLKRKLNSILDEHKKLLVNYAEIYYKNSMEKVIEMEEDFITLERFLKIDEDLINEIDIFDDIDLDEEDF
ncbi:MAG: hypothetical protein QXW69_07745 [Nitrososphaerota archaeon]